MELEFVNGILRPKAPEIKDFLANTSAFCARYARMASSKILTGEENDNSKLWTPKDGWQFHYYNCSVWTPEKGILNCKKLKEGQILGIRIPESEYNKRRDIYNNLARYSHLAAVLGHFYDGKEIAPWIAHNVYGVKSSEPLFSFLERTGSAILEVFNPKTKCTLKDLLY